MGHSPKLLPQLSRSIFGYQHCEPQAPARQHAPLLPARSTTEPSRIRLKFRGAGTLRTDDKGDLLLGEDEVRLQKPQIYQEDSETRKAIEGRYWMAEANTISFRVADYDHSRPLIIDPVLVYSTYLGGSDRDIGYGVAVDSAGNAYVTGYTLSTNFPTMNPLQPPYGGGTYNVFVSKLNSAGSALVYSTYLGGSGFDEGTGIAVDSSGNAYVTGDTYSTDFPTLSPLQPTYGGGGDAFVAKLNPTGSALVYSTYLGGSGTDIGTGIAVDSSGNAYVTGITGSANFPTTNPLQPTYGGGNADAFVAKFASIGPRYGVCLLYDPTKPVQSGATIPIKLLLCDGSGNDLSSSSITVHAISITPISTSSSGAVENSGNSNPG